MDVPSAIFFCFETATGMIVAAITHSGSTDEKNAGSWQSWEGHGVTAEFREYTFRKIADKRLENPRE
jgi:hypothetical protein